MLRYLLFLILTITLTTLTAQNCLNVNEQLECYFYAGSNLGDSTYANGFYQSQNYPQVVSDDQLPLVNSGNLSLVALPDSSVAYRNDISGFKVLLINLTDTLLTLEAQDSRLYAYRQVLHRGQWRNIDHMTSSWCGNSYHRVQLAAGRQWTFRVPCLSGKLEADTRFALSLGDGKWLYSNAFTGRYNTGQLRQTE